MADQTRIDCRAGADPYAQARLGVLKEDHDAQTHVNGSLEYAKSFLYLTEV